MSAVEGGDDAAVAMAGDHGRGVYDAGLKGWKLRGTSFTDVGDAALDLIGPRDVCVGWYEYIRGRWNYVSARQRWIDRSACVRWCIVGNTLHASERMSEPGTRVGMAWECWVAIATRTYERAL